MASSNVAKIGDPADVILSKIPVDLSMISDGNLDQKIIRSMVDPLSMKVTDMQVAYPLTASKLINTGQSMVPNMVPAASMAVNADYQKDIADESWSSPLMVEASIDPWIDDQTLLTQETDDMDEKKGIDNVPETEENSTRNEADTRWNQKANVAEISLSLVRAL